MQLESKPKKLKHIIMLQFSC